MRYWVNGEDEDYERELERVQQFGGHPPAPASSTLLAAIILIGGVQALLIVSLLFSLWSR